MYSLVLKRGGYLKFEARSWSLPSIVEDLTDYVHMRELAAYEGDDCVITEVDEDGE